MMGAELRAERERQGLTIQDVERETSIRAAYLQALEREDYSALPNEVYVKGFIRNYASFLHMDPEKLVQEYRETIHGADVGPIPKANPETTSLVNESAPFSSGSDFHERVEKSAKKQMIFLAVASVAIAFIGSIYYFFGGRSRRLRRKRLLRGRMRRRRTLLPQRRMRSLRLPSRPSAIRRMPPQGRRT